MKKELYNKLNEPTSMIFFFFLNEKEIYYSLKDVLTSPIRNFF